MPKIYRHSNSVSAVRFRLGVPQPLYVHDEIHKTVTCRTKNVACYILLQHRSIRLVSLLSYESHRLSVRDNMDASMRERRICDHLGREGGLVTSCRVDSVCGRPKLLSNVII